MSFPIIENSISFAIDNCSRVIEFVLLLFQVTKHNVAVQSFGLSAGEGEIQRIHVTVLHRHWKCIFFVFEVVAGESHLREKDNIKFIFVWVSFQRFSHTTQIFLFLLQLWVQLAEKHFYMFLFLLRLHFDRLVMLLLS